MEIRNKKTGYIFEINEEEGKKLVNNNREEFEPLDKKYMPKEKQPKTVREKVLGISCISALTKEQIIQELKELNIKFDKNAKKSELVKLLSEKGGC